MQPCSITNNHLSRVHFEFVAIISDVVVAHRTASHEEGAEDRTVAKSIRSDWTL
jgi:hypothetical protein